MEDVLTSGNFDVLKKLNFRLTEPVAKCVCGSDQPVKVVYANGTKKMNFKL